jgi:hypothetical protein
MYDITRFSLGDMAALSSALRRMGRDAQTMEETAVRIVRYLYRKLTSGPGEKACALVRLFSALPYCRLEEELKVSARGLLGREPKPNTKCLTLLATAGPKREWCSRRLSVGHQAIPMTGEEGEPRPPMIVKLVEQFGLDFDEFTKEDPSRLAALGTRLFGVFHVPNAAGSPHIPAQQEFVLREGIVSCLGFGGILLEGDADEPLRAARD